MELFNSDIKTFWYFLKRKLFLYFRNGSPEKISLVFSRESFSYISETENPKKKFLIFQETELFFYSKPWYNGTFLIIRERNIHNSGKKEFSCLSGMELSSLKFLINFKTYLSELKKWKIATSKKFIIFQEMKLSCSMLKKFLFF